VNHVLGLWSRDLNTRHTVRLVDHDMDHRRQSLSSLASIHSSGWRLYHNATTSYYSVSLGVTRTTFSIYLLIQTKPKPVGYMILTIYSWAAQQATQTALNVILYKTIKKHVSTRKYDIKYYSSKLDNDVWFGFILRSRQHDDGYIDGHGRSQINVHIYERTQVHMSALGLPWWSPIQVLTELDVA